MNQTGRRWRQGRRLRVFWLVFWLPALLLPDRVWAIDRIRVTYGLREYAEYNDNLFNLEEGNDEVEKIDDIAVNTVPDLSILYDDGETRWLARGSYRRESFIDNREASGNYYAVSGEFSRLLNSRMSFSLLGSYNKSSSLVLGSPLEEPGQRPVFRPMRGVSTSSTFLSPSLTVFWSRRFRTTLSYEDNQSITKGSLNTIDRSLSLAGSYALSQRTTLKGVVLALANRNSGLPFAERQDVNSFVTRFGFVRVFTPRLTVDFSAGPQWTKEINLPSSVTLLRNAVVTRVVNPVLGLTEPVFLSEAGRAVEDTTLGISVNLAVAYQLNDKTLLSVLLSQGTSSGQGAAGTQQTRTAEAMLSRNLNSDWSFSMRGAWSKRNSIPNEYAVLASRDPFTNEIQALDRKSFDLDDRFEERQLTFEPRLSYRVSPWMSAYSSWIWTETFQETLSRRTRVNRLQVGIEFRRDAYY